MWVEHSAKIQWCRSFRWKLCRQFLKGFSSYGKQTAFCLALAAGMSLTSISPSWAFRVVGDASYYTVESCKREGTWQKWGGRTASGEKFNENALTCALPYGRKFGKLYKVVNLKSGRDVVVRHNDTGPAKRLAKRGRVIDLSYGAFKKIADPKYGLAWVSVKEVRP